MLCHELLILDQVSHDLYERFVPPNHPLRQMEKGLDFSLILSLVA